MQPHDMAFVLAGLLETPATSAATPAGAASAAPANHNTHAGHAMPPFSNGWVAPPMYPGVLMPPWLMTLRPDVTSYRPGAGAEAPAAQPGSRVHLDDGDAGAGGGTGPSHHRWPHRDHARLQRAISRTAHRSDRSVHDRRPVHQPHQLRDRRALARHPARQPLRRRAARDAGPGAAGRLVHYRVSFRMPASTGITPTTARTCSRISASTETCSSGRASPTSSLPRTARRC